MTKLTRSSTEPESPWTGASYQTLFGQLSPAKIASIDSSLHLFLNEAKLGPLLSPAKGQFQDSITRVSGRLTHKFNSFLKETEIGSSIDSSRHRFLDEAEITIQRIAILRNLQLLPNL